MAKKSSPPPPKGKRKTTSEDLDFDFNFDDEFSSFESQLNAGSNDVQRRKTKSSKREAVTSALKGSISGAKDSLLNERSIRRFVEASLPNEYGVLFNRADDVSSKLGSLYGDAVRDLKPVAGKMAKVLDKMSKEEDSRSKKMAAKLRGLFGIYDTSKVPSKAQQEEAGLQAMLGNVFNKSLEAQTQFQAQQAARQDVKDDLDRQVEAKRFKGQYDVLSSIDRSIGIVSSYQTQITSGYQKKSLELQYRTYLTMADLLAKSNEFYEVSKVQMEAMVKNTGLPEFVKIKNSERFKEMGRNKLMDSLQRKMFGPGSAWDAGFKNISKMMKERIQKFRDDFMEGLDMVDDMQQGSDMMGEQDPNAKYSATGNLIGSLAGESFSKRLALKLGLKIRSKIPKGSGIDRFGKAGVGYAKNPQAFFYDFLNSDRFKNMDDGAFKEILEDIVKGFAVNDNKTKVGTLKGNSGLTDVDVAFDRRFYTSVTDIIPGYLARILQQSQLTAQALKAEKPGKDSLLRYDHEKGKFLTEAAIKTNISGNLRNKFEEGGTMTKLDAMMNTLGLEKKLKGEDLIELKSAMLSWLMDGKPLTVSAMASDSFTRKISPASRKKVTTALRGLSEKRGTVLEGRDMSIKSYVDIEGGNIRESIASPFGDMQDYANAGYGDLMEDMGIMNSTGSLNRKNYQNLVTSDIHKKSRVRSDIHAKGKISPYGGTGSVLDKLVGIKNYNWTYKPGQGDGGTHFGPMAQSVRSKFGSQAAPGGTSIDMITMNGINMQAISDLNYKVDSMIGTGKNSSSILDIMKAVEANTLRTAEAVEGLDGKFFMGMKFGTVSGSHTGLFARLMEKGKGMFGGLSNAKDAMTMGPTKPNEKDTISQRLFNYAKSPSGSLGGSVSRVAAAVLGVGVDLSEKTLGAMTNAYKFTKDKLVSPTMKFVSDQYDKNKSKIGEAAGSLLTGAWDLAKNIYSGTMDIVKNKIPKGLQDIWTKIKKTGEHIASVLDEPCDIYVQGETEPRIKAHVMRLNGYIDVLTQKVITRPGMITGPVALTTGEIVLSSDDITKGIFDSQGNPIESLKWRITRYLKDKAAGTINFLKESFDKLKEGGKGFGGFLKDKLTGGLGLGGRYNRPIYNVLLDIRDILLSKSGRRGLSKKSGLRSFKDEAGLAKSGLGMPSIPKPADIISSSEGSSGLFEKFGSFKDSIKNKFEQIPERYRGSSIFSKFGGLGQAKDFLKSKTDKLWNDSDGDGERDGGWKGKIKSAMEKANARRKEIQEKLKAPKIEARYRGNNIFDNIGDKLAKVKEFFGSALDDIGDIAGNLKGKFGGAGKKGMIARGGAALGKGVKNAGGLFGRAMSGAGSLLKGGANLVSKVPLVGGIGSTLLNIGRFGLGAAGMVGSGIASAAGTMITSIAASPVLPFIATAAAVGAIGYGLYKGYKYLTRNDVRPVDKIRLLQYGFDDRLKDHYHLVLGLESMVEAKAQVISRGHVTVEPKKLDMKEIFEMFDIKVNTPEGTSQAKTFSEWFYGRFIPVFIQNREALYAANPKYKLKDFGSLKNEELKTYLAKCDVPNSVFATTASPIPGIDELKTSRDQTQSLISDLSKTAGKDEKPKDLNKVDESNKPSTSEQNVKAAGSALVASTSMTTREMTKNATDVRKSLQRVAPADAEAAVRSSATGAAALVTAGTSITQKPNVDMSPLGMGDRAEGYINLQKGATLDGIHPEMLTRFKGMCQEYGEKTGKCVNVNSGYRDYATQERLHRQDPKKAAAPGRSLHEFGLAMDVDSRTLNEMDNLGLMRKYGFTRPVGGEPWHMEMSGIQGNIERAKNDAGFASEMIRASAYRGGGGYGTISSATRYKRDQGLALSLFNSSDGTPVRDTLGSSTPAAVMAKPVSVGTGGYASSASYGSTNPVSIEGGGKFGGGGASGRYSMSSQYGSNQSRGVVDGERGYGSSIPSMGAKPSFSGNMGDVKGIINEASKMAGLDPSIMNTFAAIESGFNPNAKASTSSAGGLMQFTDSTWKETVGKYGSKYGITPTASKFDPKASALMGAEYIKANMRSLSSVTKNPGPTELYAAHFLGPGGAVKLLKADPNASAVDLLPKAANANKAIFMNGGAPRTVGEVIKVLDSKVRNKAREFGLPPPSSSPAIAGAAAATGAMAGASMMANTGGGSGPSAFPTSPAQARASTPPPALTRPAPTPYGVPGGFSMAKPSYNDEYRTSTVRNQTDAISGAGPVVDILSKSYEVQRSMLDALTRIAQNVGLDKMKDMISGNPSATKPAGKPDTMSGMPIDLTRAPI